MNKYYFTFGYGHNPGIGYYTIIEAEDEGIARELMTELYPGDPNPKCGRWAFCYPSAEAAGVDRFNLIYVEPGFKFEEVV